MRRFKYCNGKTVAWLPFQLMALAASTLVDLVKNLRAFVGILVVRRQCFKNNKKSWDNFLFVS